MMQTTTPQSLLSWACQALGIPVLSLLITAGTLSFLLSLLLTLRGRGPLSAVALVLAAHLPFLVGVFLALVGTIQSYAVVAASSAAPKPSEVAQGVSVALLAPLLGMILTAPAYGVALLGGLIRSLTAERPVERPGNPAA